MPFMRDAHELLSDTCMFEYLNCVANPDHISNSARMDPQGLGRAAVVPKERPSLKSKVRCGSEKRTKGLRVPREGGPQYSLGELVAPWAR